MSIRPARLALVATTLGALAMVSLLSAQQAKPEAPMRVEKAKDNQRMAALAKANVPMDQVFERLKLADLGWDRTVSTVAFKGGLKGYYEEMKAQLPK